MNPHGDGPVGVATQGFDPLHQVGAELVAPLQYAQHHDVVVPQIVHDVASKPLGPLKQTYKAKLEDIIASK